MQASEALNHEKEFFVSLLYGEKALNRAKRSKAGTEDEVIDYIRRQREAHRQMNPNAKFCKYDDEVLDKL